MKQMLCKFLHFLPAILLLVKICKVSCISSPKIAVIGGGASGMFSAQAAGAACAENNIDAQVHVFESSSKLMSKVEISGGGRCNVLHDTTKPVSDILNGYPRGKKELNGPFNKHFSPTDARTWFQSRGVELKTEIDGRMFPVTDSSQTIMDCILSAAKENQVRINTRQKVLSVTSCSKADRETSGYTITFQNENKDEFQEHYDCVILATGSNPRGHELASSLGHKLTPPVPSLFTFNAKNQHKEGQIFHGLAGLSVQSSTITLKIQVEGKKKKKIIQQGGPLLITHHGLSGPAALRLSAFAAREFRDMNYRGDVIVHWAPEFGTAQDIEEILWSMTSLAPKKAVSSVCPLMDKSGSSVIPRRLWAAMVKESGFEDDQIWAESPKKKVGVLSRNIAEFVVDVTGKGVFKEEFVTAGGVMLKDINMKTMESKICPGIFFCGEIIDVDGVTGGFNFLNCWCTGYIAGTNAMSTLPCATLIAQK